MKINAKISYKVKPTHPDIQEMPEKYWKGKVFSYEDTYTFSPDFDWSKEAAIEYIKRDLRLVAGGGSNTKHIENVAFEIKML